MMKAFPDKPFVCETRLDDYVDILERVAVNRVILCRLKADGGGKVQEFCAHSPEFHAVSGKTFPEENIDTALCY